MENGSTPTTRVIGDGQQKGGLEIGDVRRRGSREATGVRGDGVRVDPGRRAGRVVHPVQVLGSVPPALGPRGLLHDAADERQRDLGARSAPRDRRGRPRLRVRPGVEPRVRRQLDRSDDPPVRPAPLDQTRRRPGDLGEARIGRRDHPVVGRRHDAEHLGQSGRRQGRRRGDRHAPAARTVPRGDPRRRRPL